MFPVRLACALALIGGLPVAAQQIKVSPHTLENGMKVLIHEDHDVPSVAMYLFYKIGSRNERPGTTGISHYFEHMMFNGAKKYGPKQFDIVMEKNGGRNNAYTTRDATVYTNWFPPSAMELIFDLEADRIRDLAFDPKIVESERGVVYNERRMAIDNSPFGALKEQLDAAAYIAHPYQWPVIGWASDIEAWTMDDLKAHFKMGYAPNNCILVVTGDVNEAQVLEMARKYLQPIPKQEPPPAIRTKEPVQNGERRVVIERPAQLPLLMASYHIPPSSNADTPAITVLNSILSQGRSSRLYKRLVDDGQLALNVFSQGGFSLDPNQFIFAAQVRQGVEPAAVEKALYEELEKVVQSGVRPDELQKAKNQMLVGFYRGLKTIAGKANLIGSYELWFGDHTKLNSAAQEMEKVTAADVKRVAEKYLTANNRTVATLIPAKAADKKETAK